MAALGDPGAKISSREDVVPALFLVTEAMLMPSISRTQAATRLSTTTVHLGSERAVCKPLARIQMISVQGEFGQHSLETSARKSGDFGL